MLKYKLWDNGRSLNLSCTELANLDDIELPESLQILNLSYTKIRSLEGVVFPAGLQRLWINDTELKNLAGVSLPPGLKELNLSNTGIQSLDGIMLPEGLEKLWLNETSLRTVPESIRNLRKLKKLDLSLTALDDLPTWLLELRLPFSREQYGEGICLYKTTVTGIDMSVFDQSQESVMHWLEDRKGKPLNELKVVFLGDGEAGKSHTIARLMHDGKHVNQFRGVSTPGIVIEDKSYNLDGREVKVHFWDFGGQEILHSMHRMFLTERTLYVVMLNVRDGNQDDRARYWLHNLRSFANGAPVLLVLNKIDMNPNASVNEADLRKLYPALMDIVKLSTLMYNEKEFRERFINVLLEKVGNMEILNLPLTSAGRRVKEMLQNMTENYIHGAVFRQFCNDCGVKGSDAVRRDLLAKFGELGISFCYSGSMNLEDHVVLRPDWITNAIYIILFNKVEKVKNGLVSHDTIYKMLSSEDMEKIRRTVAAAKYAPEEMDYVLKVFRKFRLSFLVEDGVEFLPMLCDANSTAAAAEYENDPNTLEFRMHYEYLPNNVIHRLMVDRRKELDQNNVWLTGARFVCGETGRSAVVKSEGNLIRILVRADKDPRDPQRYLDELKESLERINEMMGLRVAKTEVAYKETQITEYFDYERLLLAQRFGESHILSMAHRKRIRLANVLMQSDFPEDEKQKKLLENIRQACEMLQNRKKYWRSHEDERTDYIMDILTAKGYIVLDQHRGGFSAGGILSGELDLDIRLTPGDCWSALEALNLKGSSPSQIEYWNAHLKKLLDNYNEVGRSFLFHISYLQCKKDRFTTVYNELHEHLRFYSPPGFELLRGFVRSVQLGLLGDEERFLRAVKCVYDCGGITMTVYHFFVRIGE